MSDTNESKPSEQTNEGPTNQDTLEVRATTNQEEAGGDVGQSNENDAPTESRQEKGDSPEEDSPPQAADATEVEPEQAEQESSPEVVPDQEQHNTERETTPAEPGKAALTNVKSPAVVSVAFWFRFYKHFCIIFK